MGNIVSLDAALPELRRIVTEIAGTKRLSRLKLRRVLRRRGTLDHVMAFLRSPVNLIKFEAL